MNAFSRIVAALAVLFAVALIAPTSVAEDDAPSIKDIMNKAHKGGDSILSKLGKDLKAEKPDWDEIAALSKELVTLGSALGKNKPKKGDQESWDKLTKEYVETATALQAAAEKKEKKDAAAAQEKLSKSCMSCHKAHK